MVEAARALAEERPDVVFVINGGGSARADLEAAVAGLANVRFVDMQPRERLPEVLAAGRPPPRSRCGGGWPGPRCRPSCTRSWPRAGPVLAAVDEGTEVAAPWSGRGPGGPCPPTTPPPSWPRCGTCWRSPTELAAMGRDGRRFVEGWASPAAVGRAYSDLFDELRATTR